MAKPRYRVGIDGSNPRVMAESGSFEPFRTVGNSGAFEGASHGRRLRNFNPPAAHVNSKVQAAGPTLIRRARFLFENNGHAGNAVETWVSWLVGDGIRPRVSGGTIRQREKIMKLFHRWAKECDFERQTNLYGIQAKAEAEAYIAGESFIRAHFVRKGVLRSVPLQLEVLPAEMLDLNYSEDLSNGNSIRMGIEFSRGQRVAYHFFRTHPDDTTVTPDFAADLRVRVPATEVLHIMPGRTAGQIRGVPRLARAIVPIFTSDAYDDAEIARKHAAALFSVFIKKTGDAGPLDGEDLDAADEDGNEAVRMQPGAVLTLDEGEDISTASPADVGGSYEPFQYRTTLRIATATGIPYAYLTGDTTRGNFSNVRTEIMNFRRRIGQHQYLWTIPQLCEPVWAWFLDVVEAFGLCKVVDDFRDEDHGVPRQEWLDPSKDLQAEIKAVRAGFKNRSHVIASLGYDREEVDRERKRENEEADRDGLIFDTDPRRVTASGTSNAVASGAGYLSADDEPDAGEPGDGDGPSDRSGTE